MLQNACGCLYVKTTYHNPKKRGKRSFILSVEHATWLQAQEAVKDLDPRDQHEITFTTHHCEVNP